MSKLHEQTITKTASAQLQQPQSSRLNSTQDAAEVSELNSTVEQDQRQQLFDKAPTNQQLKVPALRNVTRADSPVLRLITAPKNSVDRVNIDSPDNSGPRPMLEDSTSQNTDAQMQVCPLLHMWWCSLSRVSRDACHCHSASLCSSKAQNKASCI